MLTLKKCFKLTQGEIIHSVRTIFVTKALPQTLPAKQFEQSISIWLLFFLIEQCLNLSGHLYFFLSIHGEEFISVVSHVSPSCVGTCICSWTIDLWDKILLKHKVYVVKI